MPNQFAETSDGQLMIASGMDPMLIWDGLSVQATIAGLGAPTQAPALVVTAASGILTGSYFAYVRFLDAAGNPSSLSPISNNVILGTKTGTINGAFNVSPIIITTVSAHGLAAGDQVTVFGVQGNTAANGTWVVGRVDNLSTFTLLGTSGNGTYTGGGAFVGYGQIVSASNATPIVLGTLLAHGLADGAAVQITGAQGNDAANGSWIIRVVDTTHFSLIGSTGNGAYVGGGVFLSGVASINYQNVQIPTDPKAVRRQILRNTSGQAATFYVDVDTTDVTATTFTSTLTDAVLSANTSVPILDSNGSPFANQYGVPPNHKVALAHHLGRMFAYAEVIYKQGSCQVTRGSLTVQGIGTEWTSSMVARYLYVQGANNSYQIATVDTVKQIITLASNYKDATDKFAIYSIQPAPGETDLCYYSQALLPQAWPTTNTISLPQDSDLGTGLMVMGSFLYLLKKRHIYRFTFQSDPARDGFVFLSTNRGCVNNRCYARTGGTAYILDEAGIYAFTGSQENEPVSTPVQDIFRPSDSPFQINWSAKEFFHCVSYPQQEIIRWFVALSGSYLPRHAIAFDYRRKRWWIEQYPFSVASSTRQPYGQSTPFVGSDANDIYNIWQGTLDGPDPSQGTVRGTVTSAGILSLTDTTPGVIWPSLGVVGSPVVIAEGTGKGQLRVITSVSGQTLKIQQPWSVMPDTTSIYQLGGIQWDWKSPPFRWVSGSAEEQVERRVEVIWEPLKSATTADMRIYENRSASAKVWDSSFSSTDHNGISITQGQTDLVIDLTKANGLVQFRMPGSRQYYAEGVRFVEVELTGVTNAEPLVVNQVAIEGAISSGQGQGSGS